MRDSFWVYYATKECKAVVAELAKHKMQELGEEDGLFVHPLLALYFARWCDPSLTRDVEVFMVHALPIPGVSETVLDDCSVFYDEDGEPQSEIVQLLKKRRLTELKTEGEKRLKAEQEVKILQTQVNDLQTKLDKRSEERERTRAELGCTEREELERYRKQERDREEAARIRKEKTRKRNETRKAREGEYAANAAKMKIELNEKGVPQCKTQ